MLPGREAPAQAAAVTWAAGHVLERTAMSRRLRAVAPPLLARARSRLRTWRREGVASARARSREAGGAGSSGRATGDLRVSTVPGPR